MATTHLPRPHRRCLPLTAEGGQHLASQDDLQSSPSGMQSAKVGDKYAKSTRHRKKVFGWPVFPRRKDAAKGNSILLSTFVLLQGGYGRSEVGLRVGLRNKTVQG